MPQVDFYVLSDAAPDAHLRFACRLAEKAASQSSVFMRTDTADQSRLDDLLWTFGDQSFLPHEIVTDNSTGSTHPMIKVLIGTTPPAGFRDVLINLAPGPPTDCDDIARIVEIVPADPERKQAARARFKFYRDRGVQATTHNV